MFSLFVRRDGLIDPPSVGELDAHCHILPGIDDGPNTIEGSLAIARLLIDMGIRRVVATPHIISDIYPNGSETIRSGVKSLGAVLSSTALPIELIAGAEYYAEPNFLTLIEAGDILCFGDERYVLFECPVEQPPMLLETIIFALKSGGYTPLLAHVERYRFLQNDNRLVKKLKNLGVHFQVNHPSFHLPRTSRKGEMARSLYIKGMVDMLGTDLHRATPWTQPSRANTGRSSLKSLFR